MYAMMIEIQMICFQNVYYGKKILMLCYGIFILSNATCTCVLCDKMCCKSVNIFRSRMRAYTYCVQTLLLSENWNY